MELTISEIVGAIPYLSYRSAFKVFVILLHLADDDLIIRNTPLREICNTFGISMRVWLFCMNYLEGIGVVTRQRVFKGNKGEEMTGSYTTYIINKDFLERIRDNYGRCDRKTISFRKVIDKSKIDEEKYRIV